MQQIADAQWLHEQAMLLKQVPLTSDHSFKNTGKNNLDVLYESLCIYGTLSVQNAIFCYLG
jgi:hypothetical protein